MDGITWTDLAAPKSVTTVAETGNISKFTVTQNAAKYKFYRLFGSSATGTIFSSGQIKDLTFTAPTYVPSEYPMPSCDVDKDQDGIVNHLDLDSDGDGCNDTSESITSLFTSTGVLTGNMGTNGLLNTLETTADSNTPNVTYTYNYALDEKIKGCLDSDNDNVPDVADIDDDNDGVTDIEEGAFCVPPGAYYVGPTYFKSVTAQNLLATADNPLAIFTDGTFENMNATFNWIDKTQKLVIDFTLRFPVTADGYVIGNDNGVTGDGVKDANVKLYNEANVLIAEQLFSPVLNTQTNPATPDKYAFSQQYSGIKRVVMEYTYAGVTTGAATPNYQIREMGLYREDAFCTERDTDLDGTPDHLDLDSDADGCNDSYEAGAVNVKTQATVAAPFGLNGLGATVETNDTFTAGINYESTYEFFATENAFNLCLDSDLDGIIDIDDIDDDNDGVLDQIESPSCFFAASAWNSDDKTSYAIVTSDFQTESGVFISDLLLDNNTVHGNAIVFNTLPTQTQLNKTIFKTQFFRPVKLDAWYVQLEKPTETVFGAGAGSLMVQGSNDNTTWTDLLTAAIAPPATASNTTATGGLVVANSNKFTIASSLAGYYTYYRILGKTAVNVAGGNVQEFYFDFNAGSYNASMFPRTTCTADTDGDTKNNHLDLDSDADNCADAIEAGTAPIGTTAYSAISFFNPTTTGANGFANALESATESGIYAGAYTYIYAQSNTINACTDSDNDGVSDNDMCDAIKLHR